MTRFDEIRPRYRALYSKYQIGELTPVEHAEFLRLQEEIVRYNKAFVKAMGEMGLDELFKGDEAFQRLTAANVHVDHHKKKSTPEGLPIVSYDTAGTLKELLVRDVFQRPGIDHAYGGAIRTLDKLLPENPAILGEVMAFAKSMVNAANSKSGGDESLEFYRTGMSAGILMGGLIVYQALKKQAEANKLEERLKE